METVSLPWQAVLAAIGSIAGAIAYGIKMLASGYVSQMNNVVNSYLAASTEQAKVLGEVAAGLRTMHEDHERQARAHDAQMTALQELCQHRDCPLSQKRKPN